MEGLLLLLLLATSPIPESHRSHVLSADQSSQHPAGKSENLFCLPLFFCFLSFLIHLCMPVDKGDLLIKVCASTVTLGNMFLFSLLVLLQFLQGDEEHQVVILLRQKTQDLTLFVKTKNWCKQRCNKFSSFQKETYFFICTTKFVLAKLTK